MVKITEKEKDCLLKYLEDLLDVMRQDHLSLISDGKSSYTVPEIQQLSEKVEKMNDYWLTAVSQ